MFKPPLMSNDEEPYQALAFDMDAQRRISSSELCTTFSSREMIGKVPDGVRETSSLSDSLFAAENTTEMSQVMAFSETPEVPLDVSVAMQTDQLMDTSTVEPGGIPHCSEAVPEPTIDAKVASTSIADAQQGSCFPVVITALATESQPLVYSNGPLESTIISALEMLDEALRSVSEAPVIRYEMHIESKEKLLVMLSSLGKLAQGSYNDLPPYPDSDGSPGDTHQEITVETSCTFPLHMGTQSAGQEVIIVASLNALNGCTECTDIPTVTTMSEDGTCDECCDTLECKEGIVHKTIETQREMRNGTFYTTAPTMEVKEQLTEPDKSLQCSGLHSLYVPDNITEFQNSSPCDVNLQKKIVMDSAVSTTVSNHETQSTPSQFIAVAHCNPSSTTEIQAASGPEEHECYSDVPDSTIEDAGINSTPVELGTSMETSDTVEGTRVATYNTFYTVTEMASSDSPECSRTSSEEFVHITVDNFREETNNLSSLADEGTMYVNSVFHYCGSTAHEAQNTHPESTNSAHNLAPVFTAQESGNFREGPLISTTTNLDFTADGIGAADRIAENPAEEESTSEPCQQVFQSSISLPENSEYISVAEVEDHIEAKSPNIFCNKLKEYSIIQSNELPESPFGGIAEPGNIPSIAGKLETMAETNGQLGAFDAKPPQSSALVRPTAEEDVRLAEYQQCSDMLTGRACALGVQQAIKAGCKRRISTSDNGYSNVPELNDNALGSVRYHVDTADDTVTLFEEEQQPKSKASYRHCKTMQAACCCAKFFHGHLLSSLS